MNRILEKEELAPTIKRMVFEAPLIAKSAHQGQFVVLRIDEKGERFPLTLNEWDPEKGTITVVFKEVGVSTIKLGKLNVGDAVADIVGPLGNPSIVLKGGRCIFVAGGVGAAPLVPIIKKFREEGNEITTILGATTKEMIILEKELKELSDNFYVCTDDGSYGEKGFTSNVLSRLLGENQNYDLVLAIGPIIMMKVICDITREYNIPTRVSLNPIMVDGTGICGACRVTVGGETKFTCVDGAEFDGHKVDFNELVSRLSVYIPEERKALDQLKKKEGE